LDAIAHPGEWWLESQYDEYPVFDGIPFSLGYKVAKRDENGKPHPMDVGD